MKHRAFVLATLLVSAAAQAQVQQQSAGRLEPTTVSAEARRAFSSALDAANNLFFVRSAALAAQALAADPSFGLARVLRAAVSPDMPEAERTVELDRGVANAAQGSPAELLFAAAMRSNTSGRTVQARAMFAAAATLVADDPIVAYYAAVTSPADEQLRAMRDVTRRFPEFAPAYNTLAYQLVAAGDQNGGMQTVQMYVRLAPNEPNAHDSFAELLQFAGRLPEALTHYAAAAALDSAYDQAFVGLGEVHMLMGAGHGVMARAAYDLAVAHAPTAADRVTSMAARSLTYVAEGKPKDAIRELTATAATAEQQGLKPQADGFYRSLAVLEAAFGDRAAIARDLAKAAELGGADYAWQRRMNAIAYALAGDVTNASALADRIRAASVTGSADEQKASHEVDAIVAVASRNLAMAQSELAKAGPTANLGKALVAEALKKAGRKAEADSLRTEVAKTGTVSLFDIIARARIAKM